MQNKCPMGRTALVLRAAGPENRGMMTTSLPTRTVPRDDGA